MATSAFATMRQSIRRFAKHSVWHAWKNLFLSELKAYLGVVLKMALVEKPEQNGLNNVVFSVVFFKKAVITNALHVARSVSSTKHCTYYMWKSNENVCYLHPNQTSTNYTQRHNVAVDESTVGFKGRISFKTDNPQNPLNVIFEYIQFRILELIIFLL